MISGIIISRRSIGRNLAFAEIDVTKSTSNINLKTSNGPIKVKFNRQSFLGASTSTTSSDENESSAEKNPSDSAEPLTASFPSKKSGLPYGALVQIQLGNCTKKTAASVEEDGCVWEVIRWEIIDNPKDLAEKLASLTISDVKGKTSSNAHHEIVVGNGALSCSTYLKIRRDQFNQVQRGKMHNKLPLNEKKRKPHVMLDNSMIISDEFCHGGKQAKAKRAKVFAAWVLETFFGRLPIGDSYCKPCYLTATDPMKEFSYDANTFQDVHVFDIAGGKGHLTLELVLQQLSRSIRSCHVSKYTIIDPVVRKGDAKLRHSKLQKAKYKEANTSIAPTITHLATYFTTDFFRRNFVDSDNDNTSALLLLGLHPDQCTEDIVDAALRSNVAFAVVPCCVYPDLFPNRQYWLDDAKRLLPVRTYDEFLKYLMQKDDGIKMTSLPIEGKNIVLYKLANEQSANTK